MRPALYINKIRKNAIRQTERMWKSDTIRRAGFVWGVEGKTREEIRDRINPEWGCLIDGDGELKNCRYGHTVGGMPIRGPLPKPWSVGNIHYHPVPTGPSVYDIVGWANRSKDTQERLFCIHGDEKTTCYRFSRERELPPEMTSPVLALLGYPEKQQRSIKRWFRNRLDSGEIGVLESSS